MQILDVRIIFFVLLGIIREKQYKIIIMRRFIVAKNKNNKGNKNNKDNRNNKNSNKNNKDNKNENKDKF